LKKEKNDLENRYRELAKPIFTDSKERTLKKAELVQLEKDLAETRAELDALKLVKNRLEGEKKLIK